MISSIGMIRVIALVVLVPMITFGRVSAKVTCTIEDGIDFHNIARDGGEEPVEKAIECFEYLEQKMPENSRLLAYLGSSYALKASYSESVADKMRFTNLGFDGLDYAVELAPDDFEVRLIRWTVNEAVPSLFERDKYILEDLHKLDAIYQATSSSWMAEHMIGVYDALQQKEPENAKWKEFKAKAETSHTNGGTQ